jgi:hypothetical protein
MIFMYSCNRYGKKLTNYNTRNMHRTVIFSMGASVPRSHLFVVKDLCM